MFKIGILASAMRRIVSGLLLDLYPYTAAAFSLRKLKTSYQYSPIRVRRSYDNAEQDIGFDVSGNLDQTALLNFINTTDNLHTYSEQFQQASWGKVSTTITADQTTSPIGTTTADLYQETTAAGSHSIQNNNAIQFYAGYYYTQSIYLKKGPGTAAPDIMQLTFQTNFGTTYANFNISTGVVTASSGGTASITDAGNGWWRCIFTALCTASSLTQGYGAIFCNNNPTATRAPSYTGAITRNCYMWGAQLVIGTLPKSYIVTAASAGGSAFVVRWYDQGLIGPENKFLYSDEFSQTFWNKTGVSITQNTTLGPFGLNDADSIFEANTTGTHLMFTNIANMMSVLAGRSYTISIYVKKGLEALDRDYFQLTFPDAQFGASQYANFNISTGIVEFVTGGTAAITDSGNGWWRCSFSAICTVSNDSANFQFILINTATSTKAPSYTGSSARDMYIFGAQLNEGTSANTYIQTTYRNITTKDVALSATATSPPRIVNASIIDTQNGKPAVFFNGSSNKLQPPVGYKWQDSTAYSLFVVEKNNNVKNNNQFIGLQGPSGANNQGIVAGASTISTVSLDQYNNGAYYTYAQNFLFKLNSIFFKNTGSEYYMNNSLIGTSTLPNAPITSSTANMNIGQGNSGNNQYYSGLISEMLIFTSNQLSNKTGIETELNTYYNYNNYWNGSTTSLLDSYPGAAAAYSLRNLSSTYTGPLVRVRRSNDSAEQDIYGDANGNLNETALLDFITVNSGFVSVWYDQSGYNGPFNYFLYSEQFQQAAWTKNATTALADQTLAPNATLTADKLSETATTAIHRVLESIYCYQGKTYTFSAYLKKGDGITAPNIMQLNFSSVGFTDVYANFNILSGTITASTAFNATITDAGDGWWRCSISAICTTAGTHGIHIAFVNNSPTSVSNPSYLGQTTSDVFVWGAQFDLNSSLRTYVQTVATAVIPRNAVQTTAANQPRIVNAGVVEKIGAKPSLVFDGSNDALTTPSIQFPLSSVFTANKSNVSTGVQHLIRYGSTGYTSPFLHRYDNTNFRSYGGSVGSFDSSTSTTTTNFNLLVSLFRGAGIGLFQYINSIAGNSDTTGTDIAQSSQLLCIGSNNGTEVFNGGISEVLVYPSDQSSNRTGIESNINSYYTIYTTTTTTTTAAPTTTTTTTAGASVTINYQYGYPGTCATRTWNVKKNGVIQNSGSGNTSVFGSFTAVIGDIISISVTSGASGISCDGAAASVQKNGIDVSLDNQPGFGVTATATYTVDSTSAGWDMYGGLIA